MAGTGYVATKRFRYGTDDREYDPGQYIEPQGVRHDGVIFQSTRYVRVVPLPKDLNQWRCDRCGGQFQNEPSLRTHQQRLYQQEQVAPERLETLQRLERESVNRGLQNESLADMAERQGHRVDRSGKVPLIQAM